MELYQKSGDKFHFLKAIEITILRTVKITTAMKGENNNGIRIL